MTIHIDVVDLQEDESRSYPFTVTASGMVTVLIVIEAGDYDAYIFRAGNNTPIHDWCCDTVDTDIELSAGDYSINFVGYAAGTTLSVDLYGDVVEGGGTGPEEPEEPEEPEGPVCFWAEPIGCSQICAEPGGEPTVPGTPAVVWTDNDGFGTGGFKIDLATDLCAGGEAIASATSVIITGVANYTGEGSGACGTIVPDALVWNEVSIPMQLINGGATWQVDPGPGSNGMYYTRLDVDGATMFGIMAKTSGF